MSQLAAPGAHRAACLLALIALGPSRLAGAATADPAPLPQLDAPAISSASSELVDRARFAPLGLAWNGVVGPGLDRQAFTLDVTPRAVIRAFCGATGTPRDSSDSPVIARVAVGGPLEFAHGRHVRREHRLSNHVSTQLGVRVLRRGADVLAAALETDNYGTGYGLDRYGAMLMGQHEGRCSIIVNAEGRILERLPGTRRLAEARFGAEASWRLVAGGRRVRALDLGVAAGGLLRNRGRESVGQAGARLELELPDRVRLSAAARSATEPELSGLRRTRFVFGIGRAFGG